MYVPIRLYKCKGCTAGSIRFSHQLWVVERYYYNKRLVVTYFVFFKSTIEQKIVGFPIIYQRREQN